MLRFINEYNNQPILSLRGTRRISTTIEPLIDPHKLQIVGFYSEDRASDVDKLILIEDIREISPAGIIIDSEENLTDPSDLVRLESIIDMGFEIIGKSLVTQSGKKLGKVDDFAIDDMTYKIEKIYGKPKALKTLSTNDYIISRRQIESVSESEIIVKEAVVKAGNRAQKPALNPLRS